MARAEESDFLQNFRFHARILDDANDFLSYDPGEVNVSNQAGFQSIASPERTYDVAEYREGIYKYTKKQPGVQTFGEVTLMRGITRRTTQFYDWGVAAGAGASYRADLAIDTFGHSDIGGGIGEAIAQTAARTLICHECFPNRDKPMADLDATSSDVSIAEIGVAIEWFELVADTEA